MSADSNNFNSTMFNAPHTSLSFDDVSENLDSGVRNFSNEDSRFGSLSGTDKVALNQLLAEHPELEEFNDLNDEAALRSMARNHRPARAAHMTPCPMMSSDDAHAWLDALPYGEIILTREADVVFIYASGSFEQMRTWRESPQLPFFTSVVPEAAFLGISNDFNAFVSSQALVHVFEHTYSSAQGVKHLHAMFEHKPRTSHIHLTFTRPAHINATRVSGP